MGDALGFAEGIFVGKGLGGCDGRLLGAMVGAEARGEKREIIHEPEEKSNTKLAYNITLYVSLCSHTNLQRVGFRVGDEEGEKLGASDGIVDGLLVGILDGADQCMVKESRTICG